ncbi:hypothetical protein OSB04_001521 [Centaurea solstitialis]|uniref:Uncharacterized protein n=1 Tax=Centaurea solstitialis TaxID=347529 RepID=A0AA38U2U9_9ASTR|nr:hypothetical protein OSB04_001521 [Centaurea solstitialis]
MEEGSLWRKVVLYIHGGEGNFDGNNRFQSGKLALTNLFIKNLGKGENTRFWKDIWCDIIPLKGRFSFKAALDVDQNWFVADRFTAWSSREVGDVPTEKVENLQRRLWEFGLFVNMPLSMKTTFRALAAFDVDQNCFMSVGFGKQFTNWSSREVGDVPSKKVENLQQLSKFGLFVNVPL